jgi:hypothetical protein
MLFGIANQVGYAAPEIGCESLLEIDEQPLID